MTWTFDFETAPALDEEALRALAGGKGAGLVIMRRELGLPVPPGFIISTEACRAWRRGGWPDGLDEELRDRMANLAASVGRRFGDPSDPLLVSVRSGAPVSMPGMLDTLLDLGLDEAATAGLAQVTGDRDFALGCRRRLERMYREIVGRELPDDPWQQLRDAVEAVFSSWDSPRAQAYRQREGIPHDIGTVAIVQAMVFGDRGPESATGVVFTRDPASGEDTLYGDVLFGAQGEDVVSGTHATQPLASLQERLPGAATELQRHARTLEHHFRDMCDIEFTIEQGRLWILQCRRGKRSARAALRMAIDMAEDRSFPLSREEALRRVAALLADPPVTRGRVADGVTVLARGLPASPGLVSGAVATTPEMAVRMADDGRAVILVRTETSPDDVHGMARATGILTSTGGLASHAAVVARGWDIPAVVDAQAVRVGEGAIEIEGRTFEAGYVLSIDGTSGEVLDGPVSTSEEVVPEAGTLLAWARELGMPIGPGQDPSGDLPGGTGPHEADEPSGPAREEVLRVLLIKGTTTPELVSPALGISVERLEALLGDLAGEGLTELKNGMLRLSGEGRARAEADLAASRESWGEERAAAALDGLLEFDLRLKALVTAWQMREVDGAMVLNDHSDQGRDEAVLEGLAALHARASAWLAELAEGMPRLARYVARLDRAGGCISTGQRAYIASPRVDSYHSVWFELHEELIRLAGRTRQEEVAAGRA